MQGTHNAYYFMAGYVMKMSILVSNINSSSQKDSSFKVRHKAYALRYALYINWMFIGMKHLLIIIFLTAIFPIRLLAQSCLPQGINIYTQAQIDSFQVNYPNCSHIEGGVTINGGNDITNLDGLSVVTTIDGQLWINTNHRLTDFSGLNSLTTIGGPLYINSNDSLTDFTGINSLTSIGASLYVGQNPSLTSLSGLDSLISIGQDLILSNNPALNDITSLNNLAGEVHDLTIEDNHNLPSISGLNNISHITGSAVIQRNNSLLTMNGLNSLEKINGAFIIDRDFGLTSLAGLESLDTIGGRFSVQWNWLLTNFSGVDNLKYVGNEFYIWFNYGMVDLTGLNSLTSCKELHFLRDTLMVSLSGLENLAFVKDIDFQNNERLSSIAALINVTSAVDYLYIYNTGLTSLYGLDNIADSSIFLLRIFGNEFLSDCAVQSICTSLANPGGIVDIYDNAAGCNSRTEILDACETISIEEQNVDESIIIYPNPTNGKIYILNNDQNTICQISICNFLGEIIFDQLNIDNSVDVSTLSPGPYFIELRLKKGVVRKLFIVD